MTTEKITYAPLRSGGQVSPAVVILQAGLGGTGELSKAAELISALTGRDAAAWTDNDGTTMVYASQAPAYGHRPPDQER